MLKLYDSVQSTVSYKIYTYNVKAVRFCLNVLRKIVSRKTQWYQGGKMRK